MDQLGSRKIAQRYTKALWEAAEEQGASKALMDYAEAFAQVMESTPELELFLANPRVSAQEKLALLEPHLKKAPELLKNLIRLLAQSDRLGSLGDIFKEFSIVARQKQGVATAKVVVPVPMTDSVSSKLRSTLQKLYQLKQVELEVTVDPSILAGAIVQLGDQMIDGSYRGKLDMLRKQVG